MNPPSDPIATPTVPYQKLERVRQSIYLHVVPPGLNEAIGEYFNPRAAFSGCCICGAVFQSELDRKVFYGYATPGEQVSATVQRRNWSNHHANKQHTQKEHDDLAASGRFCTPEAAHKLAPYGIVTLSDSFNEENRLAQEEAKRLPDTEPEQPTPTSIHVPVFKIDHNALD